MVRLIGVFVLLFSCVGAGVWMGKKEQLRMQQLRELIRSMEFLKGEISFARTTLPDAMEQLSNHVKPPFQTLFSKLAVEMKMHPGTGFEEILYGMLESDKEKWDLRSEDVEHFYQACSNLGYLDKEMQIHILERYIKEQEKIVEQLSGEIPQKIKLYRSLGVLGGVFLVIVLI